MTCDCKKNMNLLILLSNTEKSILNDTLVNNQLDYLYYSKYLVLSID